MGQGRPLGLLAAWARRVEDDCLSTKAEHWSVLQELFSEAGRAERCETRTWLYTHEGSADWASKERLLREDEPEEPSALPMKK